MKKNNPKNNQNNVAKTLLDLRSTNQNCPSTHHTIIDARDEITKQTVFTEANKSSQRTMLEARPTQNFADTFTSEKEQSATREQSQQTNLPNVFADKYKIVGVLGSGAMGKVFEAIEIGKARRYAIKVIHKNKEGSEEIVKRFYRESKLLQKLNHPNIIKIHEQGEFQGQPYFVMDLVKGCTFTEIIKRPSYPFRRKLVILIQVLEAVHSAHREGIIHRDLKPDNIMVTNEGKALVMDFGIARDQGDNQSTKLTKTGMLVGTPLYMSPEQINSEKTTAKSDIYTLGVIMYEVITGKVPFDGNLSKIMWQIAHSDPVHPREISDSVPKNLATICLKAMIKEKEERYTTARTMANDIKRYLKGQKISAKHPVNIKKWFLKNRSFVISFTILCLGVFWSLGGDDKNVKNDNDELKINQNNIANLPEEENDTKFKNDLPLEKEFSHKSEKEDKILRRNNQKNSDNSSEGMLTENQKDKNDLESVYNEERPRKEMNSRSHRPRKRHQNSNEDRFSEEQEEEMNRRQNSKDDRFSEEQEEEMNSRSHRPRKKRQSSNEDRFSEEQEEEEMNSRSHRPRKRRQNNNENRFSEKQEEEEMNSRSHRPRKKRQSSNEDRFSEEQEEEEMNSRSHRPRKKRKSSNEDRFSEEQEEEEMNSRSHRPRKRRKSSNEDRFSEEQEEMNSRSYRPRKRRQNSNEDRFSKERFEDEMGTSGRSIRNKEGSDDNRIIGQHFRYCQECHDLIRRNQIDLGGPPPNWSRVPQKILKQIKKHAQNK
ncbi:protein kinase [Candidatus Uabimicrobium sp. HlEnr_7]|uniref:serine/threonine-protein kinase n=1 Tax=Candidatus Uabimicrobium helgolandensis TaxID=3095367 RepID=UPI003558E777